MAEVTRLLQILRQQRQVKSAHASRIESLKMHTAHARKVLLALIHHFESTVLERGFQESCNGERTIKYHNTYHFVAASLFGFSSRNGYNFK